MGRTGRKKNGKVIVLTTEDNELKKYKKGKDTHTNMTTYLKNKRSEIAFYSENPRLIPSSIARLELFNRRKSCG